MRLAMALGERTPEMDWLVSFYHCDPRWQILKFFNEVAREVRHSPGALQYMMNDKMSTHCFQLNLVLSKGWGCQR